MSHLRSEGVSGSRFSFPACCAVLAGVVWMTFPLLAYWGWHRAGQLGIAASAVAALICWVSSTAALWVTNVSRGTANAVSGLFGAVLLRTAVPLVAGIVLTNSSRALSEGGVFQAILIYYLLTLAVETSLAVGLVKDANVTQAGKTSSEQPRNR